MESSQICLRGMHHTSKIVDIFLAFISCFSPSLRCMKKGVVACGLPLAWSALSLHWSVLIWGPVFWALCCLECGPQTSSISISREHVRNTDSRTPPWTFWIRMCNQNSRWFLCSLTLEKHCSRRLSFGNQDGLIAPSMCYSSRWYFSP